MSVYAAYACNEGSGTTVIDYSGNSRNMTITGSGQTWPAGQGSYAASLKMGATSPSLVEWNAGSAQAALSGDVTLMMWHKDADGGAAGLSFGGGLYSSAGTTRLSIYGYRNRSSIASSPHVTCRDSAGTISDVGVNGSNNDGAWHHTAVVYHSTGEIQLYQDGTLISDVTPTANPIGTTVQYIGAGPDMAGGNSAMDALQDIRVFDSALTGADIVTWMNTPVAGGSPAAVPYLISQSTGYF